MQLSLARLLGRGLRPLAVLAGLLALLGACSSDGDERSYVCPTLALVPDASQMTRFAGEGRDLTDVSFTAEIVEPDMNCGFNPTEEAIEGQLLVRFIVSRGPADVQRVAQFRYFIAIASGSSIVARQEFPLAVPFEEGQERVGVTDEVEPRVPIAPNQDGSEFQVYVGFALSRDELEFNRSQR